MQKKFNRTLKTWKRKKFLMKSKLFLTVILPFLILLLGTKVLKTMLRHKLHQIAVPPLPTAAVPPAKPEKPHSVKTQRSKPEFIQPTPLNE